ncbi:MAG: endonuclease/exonuclease/phosphatase family protein, partial [Oceanicaulis sp.]
TLAALALSGWRTALAPALPALFLSWVWLNTGFAAPDEAAGGERLTVAVFNARGSPDALARAAAWADAEDVDVIALSEVHTMKPSELLAGFPGLPHLLYDTESVDFPGETFTTRIALLSATPITAVGDGAEESDPAYERPALLAEIDTPAGPLTLTVAHPYPPRTPGAVERRRAMFTDLGQTLSGTSRFLVFGDLNASVWSPDFTHLPGRRAGDPRFITTFPTWLPRGGIVLDHILVGEALAVRRAEVGPDLGSDHRPVLAEMVVLETAER